MSSDRTFNLGMTDYTEYVLLPKLYEKIKNIAPYISIKVHAYNEIVSENFEDDHIELGIGLENKISKQLLSERLFSDRVVCVAHEDNALFKHLLTLKNYVQAEHLAVCMYSEKLSRVDQALDKLNTERNVKLSIPDILPALQTLSASSLISTLPRYMVKQAEKNII